MIGIISWGIFYIAAFLASLTAIATYLQVEDGLPWPQNMASDFGACAESSSNVAENGGSCDGVLAGATVFVHHASKEDKWLYTYVRKNLGSSGARVVSSTDVLPDRVEQDQLQYCYPEDLDRARLVTRLLNPHFDKVVPVLLCQSGSTPARGELHLRFRRVKYD